MFVEQSISNCSKSFTSTISHSYGNISLEYLYKEVCIGSKAVK